MPGRGYVKDLMQDLSLALLYIHVNNTWSSHRELYAAVCCKGNSIAGGVPTPSPEICASLFKHLTGFIPLLKYTLLRQLGLQ